MGQLSNCKNHVYDSVVIGLAPSCFDYANLNQAFRILKGETPNASSRQDVPLIATHKAKYIQTESGLLSLGPGPFVTALEDAAGVQAIVVVGKPTKKLRKSSLKSERAGSQSLEMMWKLILEKVRLS